MTDNRLNHIWAMISHGPNRFMMVTNLGGKHGLVYLQQGLE